MNRIKNSVSVLIVLSCLMLGINKIGYIVRPTDTDGAYYQIETMHSFPDNSFEVMVYGSSHAFRGISTMEMYEKYGIGAYNYGWHWQKINTIKLFLQDSLLKQKPKVALIEAYTVGTVLEDTDVTAEIYYCNYIHDNEAKKKFMEKCLGKSPTLDRRLSYYMPLAMFHDNWNSLTQQSFTGLQPGGSDYLRQTMGFSMSDSVTEIEICGYKAEEQISLNESSLEELDDIVEICKSNDIQVVFFVVPWNESYAYSDAMKKYAEEHGCVFLDLIKNYEEVGLDGKTDFSDAGHLNTNGSIKVADYIGKFLIENYKLTDMRNVTGNLWEQAGQQ